uniref:Uncharacterized protein n=1 Tax=Glossina pallidipes TaxID=7398 RepID=A0A1B0A082_GLOPL
MVNNNNQQKVVAIIQTIANGNDVNVTEVASTETCRSPTFNTSSSSSSSPSPTGVAAFRSQLSRPLTNEEVSFPEPTFSERFMRYLVLIIYLGGLNSGVVKGTFDGKHMTNWRDGLDCKYSLFSQNFSKHVDDAEKCIDFMNIHHIISSCSIIRLLTLLPILSISCKSNKACQQLAQCNVGYLKFKAIRSLEGIIRPSTD